MNKDNLIEMLSQAEKVFRKPPNIALSNDGGLCKYFWYVYKIGDEELSEILHIHINPFDYMFGAGNKPNKRLYGRSQRSLWNTDSPLRFERADFLTQRIKEIKDERDNKSNY